MKDIIDVVDAHALKTLPSSRIGLQTVSLFAVSARTFPAQCETRDEISGSAVSLRSNERAKIQHRNHTERGIKPQIESLPETPPIKPLWFQVPLHVPKRRPAPKLMDHKRGNDNEIKSELHRLTPMTQYAKHC